MVLGKLFSRKNVCTLLLNMEGTLAERHRHFKEFLCHNHEALNLIAELEEMYYAGRPFGMGAVQRKCETLLGTADALVKALSGMARGRHGELADVCSRIGAEIGKAFAPEPLPRDGKLTLSFSELTPDAVSHAGGKATNLATARNVLHLPTPAGFVITSHAFGFFLEAAGLADQVREHLAAITPEMTPEMEQRCAEVRKLILEAPLPSALSAEIFTAYEAIEAQAGKGAMIALRSSAVGEDTEASFAGQYVSRLNVGRENILTAYKEVLASKYTPRAIVYRMGYGLEDGDTPMCVAGVAMVDTVASGVLYTVDPAAPDSGLSRASSLWGLGELLVSGDGSPDVFSVDRRTNEIVRREIGRKKQRLESIAGGGTVLVDVPEGEQEQPSVREEIVRLLARYGLALESHFGGPQDVEWAVDTNGALFILQSRPLGIPEGKVEEPASPSVIPGHRVLLDTGKMAARGAARGIVAMAAGRDMRNPPADTILVAQTASPDYAAFAGKIRGIITDVGSPASHLASVAREFGIPAIVDTGCATTVLRDGQPITLVADTITVYEGFIPELPANTRAARRHIFESPVHRRLRAVLDKIAPLHLTDPASPLFSPDGCSTLHDIIRFAHETAMREMFQLAERGKDGATAAKLTANIPLSLYCIDLGGGLRAMLTTCDTITPDHIESLPMRALWRGFSHPGITWSGTVSIDLGGIMGLMAASATAEIGGGTLGGNSYAVLSRDYLNLSAKFGYHYANLDAHCSEEAARNHILLQFSGGVGGYVGKSLRIHFLANVLGRLGYGIAVTGDMLEASVKGETREWMDVVLDQTGRLLASSRLLDMAISSQEQVETMTASFFNGDYDFLQQGQNTQIPGFYTHVGQWTGSEEGGRALCHQDGSKWGANLSAVVAKFMGRMVGAKYQEFLDNIEAYYYFPIAIAKESAVTGDAVLRVGARAESGAIDRAAGLAFAIRNVGNYFVLRFNTLEDNVMLFEFVNNRRFTRANVAKRIETGRWYELMVEVRGKGIKGYLDGELLLEYIADRPLDGHAGLWTKADSVSSFGPLVIESGGVLRRFGQDILLAQGGEPHPPQLPGTSSR